jgi:Zn-finger nucleic acid-binding protein
VGYRDTQVLCPSCRIDLIEAELGERACRQCPRCRGLLIESSVVRDLFHEASAAAGRARPMPELMEHEFGDPPRPCAVCREPMTREFYDWLQLDECQAHGIWFDDGELDELLQNALTKVAGLA